MRWWTKYKDNPGMLKTLADDMIDMSRKLESEFNEREWFIYNNYGTPKGSAILTKVWKKRIDNLWEEKNKAIHPLWEDISAIYDYLCSLKHE